jgi:hypothetical protein
LQNLEAPSLLLAELPVDFALPNLVRGSALFVKRTLLFGKGADACDRLQEGRGRRLFVEFFLVSDVQDLSWSDLTPRERAAEALDFGDRGGAAQHGEHRFSRALLDALRDFDFALSIKQGDFAHAAEIDLQRIAERSTHGGARSHRRSRDRRSRDRRRRAPSMA